MVRNSVRCQIGSIEAEAPIRPGNLGPGRHALDAGCTGCTPETEPGLNRFGGFMAVGIGLLTPSDKLKA